MTLAAAACALHAPNRRRAAEKGGHEIHLDLLHQIRFRGAGYRRHTEAARKMDGRPQLRQALIEPPDSRFIRELDLAGKRNSPMAAQGEALHLTGIDIRDVTDRARLDQAGDHRAPQRAGTARDDDMTITIIHRCFSVWCVTP